MGPATLSNAQVFQDRYAAGKVVARALIAWHDRTDCVVVGLARGGVVVAAPVALALGAPLLVMVARKLGVPGIEEVAFGAIAEEWSGVVTDAAHEFIGIPEHVLSVVVDHERKEVRRRVLQYRGHQPFPDVRGKTVIVVDDGLATGATLKAAGLSLRSRHPATLIAAVPVASRDGLADVNGIFDDVIASCVPEVFTTVSAGYHEFATVTDAELVALLGRAGTLMLDDVASDHHGASGEEQPVAVPLRIAEENLVGESHTENSLDGDLGMPPVAWSAPPRGLVILAHGGGSSRQSYRNRYLAARLRMAGWATLRIDLLLLVEQLTDAENGEVRFDIDRITRRLRAAAEWARGEQIAGSHEIVLFGSSTGAAAAIGVAAALPGVVTRVMCRGGRVDVANVDVSQVAVPMLFVVGGLDRDTLDSNRRVARRLAGPVQLRVVRDAGHTFEETGALGRVGELAVHWLEQPTHGNRIPRFVRRLRQHLRLLSLQRNHSHFTLLHHRSIVS